MVDAAIDKVNSWRSLNRSLKNKAYILLLERLITMYFYMNLFFEKIQARIGHAAK